MGHLYISAADVAAAEGRVFPKYSGFPPEIERVLARLVLFDWVGDPTDPLSYRGRNGYPFGFKIPFVLRVDDNDLGRPQTTPDCSTLLIETVGGPYTGEELEIPYVIFDLNESRAAAFEEYIQRADKYLGYLEKKDRDSDSTYLETFWPFLKVAMGNLIKAFFTDELEQLLWHITALEALLGEERGIRRSIAKRSATIIGTTEGKKEEIREQFTRLYKLRCDLVHGNQFKKDIHRQQLFEARMMVLQVTIWFVHYLGETAAKMNEGTWGSMVPTRKDFFNLLDQSDADQKRLRTIRNNLPNEFPSAPVWSP